MLSLFLHGFKYPFQGLSLIFKKGLFRHCLPAILINVLFFVVLLALLVVYGTQFNDFVVSLLPEGSGMVGTILAVARATIRGVLYLVELLLVLVILNLGGSAVASPFLDSLSESVERELGLPPAAPISLFQSLLLALANGFRSVGYDLLWMVLLLPLNLVPVVGSGCYLLLNTLLMANTNTLQYLSYPLDRRNVPFAEERLVVQQNRALSLGFGLAVALLTYIPMLQLLLLPMAAVGGTLFFGDLVQQGKLPKSVAEKCL